MRKLSKLLSFVAIIFILTSSIGLLSGCSDTKSRIPKPTSEFYVNDFAGIFSTSQKDTMLDRAEAFADSTDGIQVVVTTVKTLDGMSVEDYAKDMYNLYGIGKDDKGALILLSTKEREIRIEVGYGLEHIINDAKAGNLIDSIIDDLRNNRFAVGLVKLQANTIDEINSNYVPVTRMVEQESVSPVTASKETTNTVDQSKQVRNETAERTAETPQNKQVTANEEKDSNKELILSILSLLLVIIPVLIYFILKNRNLKRQYESTNKSYLKAVNDQNTINAANSELNSQISDLKNANSQQVSQITALSSEKDYLESKVTILENRIVSLEAELEKFKAKSSRLSTSNDQFMKKLILLDKVYPNMDEDIKKYYAREFDTKYSALQTTKASSHSIEKFKDCMNAYKKLSDDVKAFVTVDMPTIRVLHEESCTLKNKEDAGAFNQQVRNSINSVSKGTEKMLSDLRMLKASYNNLSSHVRRFVDSSLVDRLDTLISEGEEEKRKREEAERIQHQHEADTFVQLVKAKIGSVTTGTEEMLEGLRILKRKYDCLSAPVKSFVDSSVIKRLERLISDGEEEKRKRKQREKEESENQKDADDFKWLVNRKIGSAYSGSEHMLSDLEDLKSKYNRLSSPVKALIDSSIIRRIDNLISEAEDDKRRRIRREEDEQRRRREREDEERRSLSNGSTFGSYHSSSSSRSGSSSHSSHHSSSGFGGRSGGGGASRKF
ncbi:MAG: TPM domain-containing protein [Clostridia bacterium]|nr:TPM domain-containing protein [Clostridia bacterium]